MFVRAHSSLRNNLLFRTFSTKSFSNFLKNKKNNNILQNIVKSKSKSKFLTTTTTNSTTTNDNYINIINDDNYKIYSGPLSGTTKKLKTFSVASLIITTAMSPIIMIINSPMGFGARIVLIIMSLTTSAFSTGLIHLCISPYVKNIYYNPSISSNSKKINQSSNSSNSIKLTSDSFLVFETLTLFGRSNFTILPIKSLEPSFRFFTTWKVKNNLHENELNAITKKGKKLNPKKHFFIHSELYDDNNNDVMRDVINKIGLFS